MYTTKMQNIGGKWYFTIYRGHKAVKMGVELYEATANSSMHRELKELRRAEKANVYR